MTKDQNKIVLYQGKNGNVELRADIDQDTIWATQEQISKLFNTQRPAITKHLENIFKTGELIPNEVCSILELTASDSKKYKVKHYNLDAIIAVGYRVNSKKATQFRIWATGILRKYLVEGFTLNEDRLKKSPESLANLYKAVTFLESVNHEGTLRGKITLKLTEDLVPRARTKK